MLLGPTFMGTSEGSRATSILRWGNSESLNFLPWPPCFITFFSKGYISASSPEGWRSWQVDFFCTDFVKISSKYKNKNFSYIFLYFLWEREVVGDASVKYWCPHSHSLGPVCGTKTKYHHHSIFLKKRKFGVKGWNTSTVILEISRLWWDLKSLNPGSSTSSGCPCHPARVPRSPSAHSLSAVSCIGTRNAAWLLFWPDFKIITFVRRSSVKSGIIHTQCKQAPLFQIWSREVYIYQLG